MTTTQRIVIEGSKVSYEEINVVAEARLEDIQPHLVTYMPSTFPILPRNTKYIGYDPNTKRGLIIIEMAPKRANLLMSGRSNRRYKLQLPYQYFVYHFTMDTLRGTLGSFSIGSSDLYWRPAALRLEKDELYVAKLPNVDGTARICWGYTDAENTSLNARIDDLTANFEHTQFNADLGWNSPGYGSSYSQWEKDSEANPLIYMEWPYWKQARDAKATIMLKDLSMKHGLEPAPFANLDPSFVTIPQPPSNFTIARTTEWLNALNEGQRRRFLAAVTLMKQPKGADIAPPELETVETASEAV